MTELTSDPVKIQLAFSTIPWYQLFGAVMTFNTFNYFIALYLNDLSIVDITWSLMFLIPNGIILWDRYTNDTLNPVILFTFGVIAVWAFRLAIHIGSRHKGEDYRYVIIKKRWEHRGPVGRFISAYLWVFGMQGLFSMVNNAAAIYIMRYSVKGAEFGPFEIVGGLMWIIGFLFEAVGDSQLQAHRDDESKKGTLIRSGLWKYTRHPNYFGEAFSWWGIYVIACGTEGGYWTFYSALFITLLLRYVSGVAMLERKQKKKADFRVYMLETSAFIPSWYSPIVGERRDELLEKFTKEIEEEEAKKEAAKAAKTSTEDNNFQKTD